ncbi:MAG TPA: hypothetical protein VFR99_00180 [Marmoricola sp.]|nr:hypothetical protein [Marmoricola sp.]
MSTHSGADRGQGASGESRLQGAADAQTHTSVAARLWLAKRRRALLFVVAVAVVAVAGMVLWNWRQISVYPKTGGWGAGSHTWSVGRPIYFGMSYEPHDAHGTITIRSARANVVHDSANARIVFQVCTIDPGEEIGAIGSSDERGIRKYCSSLVPAAGATLKLNARPFQQVVMAVTLTRPGEVEIDGMNIDYERGWQRGSDLTGGTIVVGGPTRHDR